MGVNLKDLIKGHDIEWGELTGKSIAIDAMNTLYQFLSIIRQADGTPLMDSNGGITSHLTGLFYRSIRVYENGIKPCYVFDGKPHELKFKELERRREIKENALVEEGKARERGDLVAAKKYASRTSRFTKDMLSESRDLVEAMGFPLVQAPCEGEVQCAHMASSGAVYATGSQDYDTLLAGSPTLIKNMTMQEKFQLERIDLNENLTNLGLTREQLVDIAILVGTDFNTGGVKGIGPKKALKVVVEGNIDIYREQLPVDLDELRGLFLNPDVSDDYELKWSKPSEDEIRRILIDKHDFSEQRVDRGLARLNEAFDKNVSQSSLNQWF
jgi:flap endonuclease-1